MKIKNLLKKLGFAPYVFFYWDIYKMIFLVDLWNYL